jgi:hypothetical protein
MAGWVARTRPLAGPLSPRGPQPVVRQIIGDTRRPQWAARAIVSGTRVVVPLSSWAKGQAICDTGFSQKLRPKKVERPVGGPTARALGMEGTVV